MREGTQCRSCLDPEANLSTRRSQPPQIITPLSSRLWCSEDGIGRHPGRGLLLIRILIYTPDLRDARGTFSAQLLVHSTVTVESFDKAAGVQPPSSLGIRSDERSRLRQPRDSWNREINGALTRL